MGALKLHRLRRLLPLQLRPRRVWLEGETRETEAEKLREGVNSGFVEI